MKNTGKIIAMLLVLALVLGLAACGSTTPAEEPAGGEAGTTTFKVGVCNFVDDASLNQIYANIESRLQELGKENDVTFEIVYDNCNADSAVLTQIIANFMADDVDLMVGIATPVALQMQAATEEIPVVFAAVSDPLAAGLVDTLENPGKNITGTSDYLDTTAVMDLIFAQDPDADKIALLYDAGQDSSTTAIAEAKSYLDARGVEYIEYNGTNSSEVLLAAQAIAADECDAVFTPSDNTIMAAELSIYEVLRDAGIPHYAGADSFALNGAFLGYGVDYANLGRETADMVCEILVGGADPAATGVKTFDNGIATVNTEIAEALGLDFDELSSVFAPYCTKVASITTAEEFSN